MDFNDFSEQLPKIKNLPLPGRLAHYKMAPLLRVKTLKKGLKPGIIPKRAAVMAMFYPNAENTTSMLLILRKTYPGVHSNQIGFPGGQQEDADTGLLETALRETEEEVGVPREEITVIRSLSQLYIPPSNFEVRPYIGLYDKRRPFVPQQSEIEALVEVPLYELMDDRLLITQRLRTSYADETEVPAFQLSGHVVWGATAMMLSEIKELLKRVI
jgi:8-oxo-dGTP pyrophosphatase MutT (NUDIX family)